MGRQILAFKYINPNERLNVTPANLFMCVPLTSRLRYLIIVSVQVASSEVMLLLPIETAMLQNGL